MMQSRATSECAKAMVRDAFLLTHEGISTDELLCDDHFLLAFDSAVQHSAQAAGLQISIAEGRWTLLNLRKSGKLGKVTQRQIKLDHDAYKHIAETAARITEDHYGVKIDRVLCDPRMRDRFDEIAGSYSVGISSKHFRLAALSLRKAKKLQPLVAATLVRPSEILFLPVPRILRDGSCVPRSPGVYVFDTPTQCLYVGEADNLFRRIVQEHCIHSDRKRLAEHLWRHGPEDVRVEVRSYAGREEAMKKPVRRVLEAELIESRQPAFNIQGT